MYWVISQLRDAGVPWSLRTLLFLVGAFVIGIAMAKLLELPVLRIPRPHVPVAHRPAPCARHCATRRNPPTPARQAA